MLAPEAVVHETPFRRLGQQAPPPAGAPGLTKTETRISSRPIQAGRPSEPGAMRWPRPRSQTEGLGTPASRGSCASW